MAILLDEQSAQFNKAKELNIALYSIYIYIYIYIYINIYIINIYMYYIYIYIYMYQHICLPDLPRCSECMSLFMPQLKGLPFKIS